MLKKRLFVILSILCALALSSSLWAADFYVSTTGSDNNSGTEEQPFVTIQKAAETMQAGDTCYIKEGRYRETVTLKTSGSQDRPIRFIAAKGARVVVDGTEPVTGKWQKHEGNIWKVVLNRPQVEQLFADDVMQHEARWPDMPFEKRWNRKFWAKAGKGSLYGKLEAKGVKATGVDWTGGIAMLNVGHQFFTWTRDITSHQNESDFLTYDQDLPGLGYLDPKKGKKNSTQWAKKQWSDDFFYLFGKLEALTAPTEWFHDPGRKLLYYMPQGEQIPRNITVKVRDYGIRAKNVTHVLLQGIHFMGCAFEFTNCKHISLTDCHLLYPNYRRRLVASEQKKYKTSYRVAILNGSHNTMIHCSVQFAGGTALSIVGDNNLFENSIIRDGCWSGTLRHPLVKIRGRKNVMRRNTVSQSGSTLVTHNGTNIIELNHFYSGGLLSEDVASIYTQGAPDGERCRGSIIRYNWVHGVRTWRDRGLGIRGDDMTRGLIVHHNVVWDCGMAGIIVKGGENQVFNNTVFDVSSGKAGKDAGLIIPTKAEPRKPWQPYHKLNIYLDVQNSNSIIANNLVDDIDWRNKKIKASGIKANVEVRDKMREYLVDPDSHYFRLKKIVLERLPKAFNVPTKEGRQAKGGYVGAYSPDGPAWKPGADWTLE